METERVFSFVLGQCLAKFLGKALYRLNFFSADKYITDLASFKVGSKTDSFSKIVYTHFEFVSNTFYKKHRLKFEKLRNADHPNFGG